MRYRSGRRGRSPAAHSLFLIATPSYLQAGAPSEVAIPAGSAPSLTKIEHVTYEPPNRLLFVYGSDSHQETNLIQTQSSIFRRHKQTIRASGVHNQLPRELVKLKLDP